MLVPLPEEAISVFASIVVSIEVLLVGTPIKSQPVDVPASPVPFIHLWYLLLLAPESLIVPATIILEKESSPANASIAPVLVRVFELNHLIANSFLHKVLMFQS